MKIGGLVARVENAQNTVLPQVRVTGIPDTDTDVGCCNELLEAFLSDTVSDTLRENCMALVRDIQERVGAAGPGEGYVKLMDEWWYDNVEVLTYIGDGHYFSWSFWSGIEIVPEEYIIINEFENIVRGSINEWDLFNEANKPE